MGRSSHAQQAAAELVAKGMWKDDETEWTVVHHADVIRQSLAAQLKKREDDKEYQRKRRRNVGTDVVATQTDRQTSSLKEMEVLKSEWTGLRVRLRITQMVFAIIRSRVRFSSSTACVTAAG